MYIYFKSYNSVLTCEEYPHIMSIEYMKSNKLENLCNKWEKYVFIDDTFTLSYKYKYEPPSCNCDNSDNYVCYLCCNCGTPSMPHIKEGTQLYLQNSGNSISSLWVKPINSYSGRDYNLYLCKLDGYPNVYKWETNKDCLSLPVIHISNGSITDADVREKLNFIQDMERWMPEETHDDIDFFEKCQIIFTEHV